MTQSGPSRPPEATDVASPAAPGLDGLVRAMLDRARGSLMRITPRIEVLGRACVAAGLPASDAMVVPAGGAVSPRTQQALEYLAGALPGNSDLTRRVQGAVLQYQGALRTMEQAENHLQAGTLAPEHVEALKLSLFFLSRFGEQFQHDPVLGPLFPRPQTVQGTTAPAVAQAQARPLVPPPPIAPPSRPAAPSQRAAADPITGKIERLMAYLGPKMEVVRLVITMLDPTQIGKVGDMMSPSARLARTLSATLKKSNRQLLTAVQEAYSLFLQLTRAQRSIQSNGPSEADKQTYFRLRVLTMQFLKEPLLAEIFPAGDRGQLADA